MKKLTYKRQLQLGVVIVILGFLLATILQNGVLINIAWTLYGLIWLVNPVFQANYVPRKRDIVLLRIVAGLIAYIGLTGRFGV